MDQGLGPVPAGCMPRVIALPGMRSTHAKRWRAAALLPHSNPTHLRPGQHQVKGKDPLSRDKTLLSVKPRRKENPLSPAVWSVSSLMYGYSE